LKFRKSFLKKSTVRLKKQITAIKKLFQPVGCKNKKREFPCNDQLMRIPAQGFFVRYADEVNNNSSKKIYNYRH